MSDQAYRLVFRGVVAADMPMETVKDNLAKLFKTDTARIEPLFSGRPVVLKKGLGREEAERYRVLLQKAGAEVDLVCAAEATPPPPPAYDGGEKPSDGPVETAGVTEADPTVPATAGTKRSSVARRDHVAAVEGDTARDALVSHINRVLEALRSAGSQAGAAGAQRRHLIWAGAALVAGVLVAAVLILSGGSRPMPIEPEVFDRFAKQYYRDIRRTDLAGADTQVLIARAREVVEDMGFDFDRTLLFWLLHKDLVERRGAQDIYRTILVEPVAVAVSAGLSGIESQIAPETREVFETAAAVPPGVDLSAIRMVRACPGNGDRLVHDDLVKVLGDHGIPVDPGQPDLSIADAFFGLEQAGLIDILRRWENDTQFSDVEILAPEAMRRVERQLEHLAAVKRQTERP